MAIATWNGHPIPGVKEIDEEDTLQADEGTTAGGALRRDVVSYRRQWTLRTAPVPVVEAEALRDAIRASVYGVGLFWLEGLPEPIDALADPPLVRWVLRNYRQVELTIRERTGRME